MNVKLMVCESKDFSVDPFRADLIEGIAKDNKTIFTSFEDFVSDAIATYINWWKFPERSQSQFEELIPHMKDEMLENLKTILPTEHYKVLTKDLAEKRSKLINLKYEPSPPGKKIFSLDPLRLDAIEEIINTENVSEKINSSKKFFDYAITLYVTWLTKPADAQPLMYDIWDYMPTKTKLGWKNNPNKMWREIGFAWYFCKQNT